VFQLVPIIGVIHVNVAWFRRFERQQRLNEWR